MSLFFHSFFIHLLHLKRNFDVKYICQIWIVKVNEDSNANVCYRGKFPEQEMYKPLRRAQMARWAHKSVAEGVAFFKKGQHEEAFQCLGKALHIDEENVEAYVAKGAL